MTSAYLCNLIIPGAAKSGTSSLHEYLDTHPMISMSSNKEPHHFCRAARYSQGADAHNALFDESPSKRYYGESSTGYLPSREAAQRVVENLSQPKAIIILRHPVARSFSHYRWRYRLGLEKRRFLEAITQDGYGYDPEKPTESGYMAYLEFSKYSHHCPVWEDALGPENCLLLAAEEMLIKPRQTLQRCFAFLDIPAIELSGRLSNTNETAKLGRLPPKKVAGLAAFIPSSIKTSPIYKVFRDAVLRAAAPEPPEQMTDEERVFVEKHLAEDIAWYESRFSGTNGAY